MFLFINKCTLYNYADDNSLSCAGTTVQEVTSSLQFDGSCVIQWFTDNGMQANPSKFQFMIISPDADCAKKLEKLVLNGNTVLVSEKQVQVLGVIIECKLNFSLHVSSICTKAARQLNALARISNYLDESARKIIYNSFVASNFNYCPLVWHFCGATSSNRIEKNTRTVSKNNTQGLWIFVPPIAWNGKHDNTCHLETSDPDTWSIQIHTPIQPKVY